MYGILANYQTGFGYSYSHSYFIKNHSTDVHG